jgi:asparagine synthase (glutamine-hydrolysing)
LIRTNNPLLATIATDRGLSGRKGGLGGARAQKLFCETTFKLDYVYNEGLPNRLTHVDPLLHRFGWQAGLLGLHKFVHYRSWFRRELAPYVRERLENVQAVGSAFWNSNSVGQLAAEHTEGRRNFALALNAVLTLEAVERLLFKGLPRTLDDSANATASVKNTSSD